jgi:hypothetical protein
MLHSKHITVAANTTELNATKTQFLVNQGVIYRVWVQFPPGCHGKTHLRIYHEGHPFLPVDQDAYISGDNYVFEYPVMYEITDAPERITIEAWNIDVKFPHTIDVQFLIIPKMWVQPVGAYEGIIAALKSLFSQR